LFARERILTAIEKVLTAFGRDPAEALGSSTVGLRLCEWAERVLDWNRRIDLTAARSVEELVDLLVADAAFVAGLLPEDAGPAWVDVGSGAGAPGLALALLNPRLAMTLVEPKAKRVAFLRSTLGALERSDVRVERRRVEELPVANWDVAISRATLEPSTWLEQGARIARRRVWVLLAQGGPPTAPGLQIVADGRYAWPLTGLSRRAVAYELIPGKAE
jgi:16S rRNA (guanine527-N7)-methyltransferase